MNHWAELPTLARVFYLKVSALCRGGRHLSFPSSTLSRSFHGTQRCATRIIHTQVRRGDHGTVHSDIGC